MIFTSYQTQVQLIQSQWTVSEDMQIWNGYIYYPLFTLSSGDPQTPSYVSDCVCV